MKPTRKMSRRSYVSQVSGATMGGNAVFAAKGKTLPPSDHDLAHPPGPGGTEPNDHDS